MPDEAPGPVRSGSGWPAKQVYTMAAICLLVGLTTGYLFRGSGSLEPKTGVQLPNPAGKGIAGVQGHMPTLEQMKQMADKKVEPLLTQLKADPNNKDVLIQAGNLYKAAHQFKDAAAYYDRALQVDPKNVVIRTEMASCIYYNGDVDGAIAQLQQSLQYDPKDANSLFNLGMIRYQGKQDAKGALAAWEQLLKTNPQLSADRKATVQKLIAEAKTKMQGKS